MNIKLLQSIKRKLLYLSRKRIELSLMLFIPAFLAIFAFASGYIVQDMIFVGLNKNIISTSSVMSARGNVNIILFVSTLMAIITGFILAYSILLPIKRILRDKKNILADQAIPDSILGRDFGLMVTSLNKYVDILESMSGGIITVNSRGVVTTMNPSAEMILGCESEGFIGKTIEEISPLPPPLSRGELKGGFGDFKKIIYESLRDKKVYSSEEIKITTQDNRRVSLGVTTSLLKDKEGAVTGIVVNFKDLTRIKQMHSQLQRADRLASLGGVAAGVAHEIRNPLGSIKGLAQLLSEELSNVGQAESNPKGLPYKKDGNVVGQGFSLARGATLKGCPTKDDENSATLNACPTGDNAKWKKYIDTIVGEVDRLNVVVENLLNLTHPDKVSMRLCNIVLPDDFGTTNLNLKLALPCYYVYNN